MQRSIYLLLFLGAVFSFALQSPALVFAQSQYAYLHVADPRGDWQRNGQGSIEEATLVVKPKGIFAEYDLFLTFSSRGTSLTSSKDTLEIAFSFSLPPDAHITDSWLWVGDSIVQAKIFDRSSASAVYEAIVSRRRDPSILTKEYYGSYTLRVFPMLGNEQRKVKISYLMPTTWTSNNVYSPLPIEFLQASWFAPSLRVICHQSPVWNGTRLLIGTMINGLQATIGQSEERLTETFDRSSGEFVLTTTLQGASLKNISSARLEWKSPARNGVFVQSFAHGNDRYYQMAFSPMQALGHTITRKAMILLDYDPAKSTATFGQMVATAQRLLREHYTDRDSFNIMVADVLHSSGVRKISSVWLSVDSINITHAFALAMNMPTLFSNLPRLLVGALSDIKTSAPSGGAESVLLISNSDGNGSEASANQLVQFCETVMKPLPPIHIADFADKNYTWYTIRSVQYSGNEYLYATLAERSKGTYTSIRANGRLETTLSDAIQAVGATMQLAELHTGIKEGFCYHRFLLGTTIQGTQQQPLLTLLPSHQTLLQVGKMVGSGTFFVQAGGFYNGQSFLRNVEIQQSEMQTGDSTTKSAWAGSYINALESSIGGYYYYWGVPSRGIMADVSSSAVTREIIAQSLQHRVLSRYTAFLALEPNDTTQSCLTCTTPTTDDGAKDAVIRGATTPSFGSPMNATSVSNNAADFFAGNNTSSHAEMLALANIVPNPFSDETTISIALSENVAPSAISIGIFDMLGHRILAIPSSALVQGRLHYTWRGNTESGTSVAAGMYMLIIQTPNNRYSVKLIKL